ncbi:MAG: MBL fold metallo-hydrolase, partial [bacterium]|nr:MBL fold metallo-hydrolase [bacterium]
PASIDFLLVTHAHIDHVGRIPKLVRDGFHGKIISTPQTLDLSRLMLPDAFSVLRSELPHGEEPMYDEKDIAEAFSLWETRDYHEPFQVGEFEVVMKDSGHILGSAMMAIRQHGGERSIVFTGDLGNTPTPLLKPAETITDATYMVMESVYGDRNHEGGERRKERLAEVISASVERGGTLLIPCFSLEKTQVLLYEMDDLLAQGKIPKVPVFLDSPLAIKVTDVYRRYTGFFNAEAQEHLRKGNDIFSFPNLRITMDAQASTEIVHTQSPKIIIAGSGMSAGGRILDHERRYLGDPSNTILFIGYQAIGGLGRHIQEGVKDITIKHERVKVRAHIETITGYSSHKDSEHLVEFASAGAETFQQIFVVMGEPKSALFLAQRIHDYVGVSTQVPVMGERVEIEL